MQKQNNANNANNAKQNATNTAKTQHDYFNTAPLDLLDYIGIGVLLALSGAFAVCFIGIMQ